MKCYIFNPFGQPSRSIKAEIKCVKCKTVKPKSMFLLETTPKKRICDECKAKTVRLPKKEKPTHKVCSKCEQLKPLIDFEVFGARMIRHSKLCRACRDTLVL